MARGDMALRRRQPEGLAPDGSQPFTGAPTIPLATPAIEAQCAAARSQPRSLSLFRRRIEEALDYDPSQITSLIWTREVDGKMSRGPSARLAELLIYGWGNARATSHTTAIGRDYVEAEGVCLDVETNTATAITVRRSTRRQGSRMSHEEVLTTATAAGSVARRNAILAAIPQLIWGPVLAQVERRIAGDLETLEERRIALVEAFEGRGVPLERLLPALGLSDVQEIGVDALVTLHGLYASLTDGGADSDELFPDPNAEPPPPPQEGFSLAFVAAEIGGAALVADPEPEAAAELEAPPTPEPEPEPVDPVQAWTDALISDAETCADTANLDALVAGLTDRSNGDMGLFLAGRGLLAKRRREIETAKRRPRDETIDIFESIGA